MSINKKKFQKDCLSNSPKFSEKGCSGTDDSEDLLKNFNSTVLLFFRRLLIFVRTLTNTIYATEMAK